MTLLASLRKRLAAACRILRRKLGVASPALLIGITGSIACGKSAVGKMLTELGVLVIDTDDLTHELYAGPNPTYDAILARFGKDLAPVLGGPIDRKRLAFIFKDTAARRDLEAIVHPAVLSLMHERANQARPGQVVAVQVPLLFEAGLQNHFDEIWTITVRAEIQLERLMKRNGLSETDAKARIAAQWSQEKKVALSKRVIDNSGTLDATRQIVAKELGTAKREFKIG